MTIKIEDWIKELDKFIQYQDLKILKGLGKVSRLQAEKKALSEYKLFRQKEIKKQNQMSEIELQSDIKELENFAKKLKD